MAPRSLAAAAALAALAVAAAGCGRSDEEQVRDTLARGGRARQAASGARGESSRNSIGIGRAKW